MGLLGTELEQEILAMDAEAFPPNQKLLEGDQVIGEVTDTEARKVYSLWKMAARDAELCRIETRYISREEAQPLAERYDMLTDKSKVLCVLFWWKVRNELKDWGRNVWPEDKFIGVAIKQGWKLARVLPQANHQPFNPMED